jgi:3'-phosphoadenosine 5'-phosphosulfate sulfotransferase
VYKYLGFKQSSTIIHIEGNSQIEKQFYSSTKCLLKTFLTGNNETKAVNTHGGRLLNYSFVFIIWTKTDIRNINIKLRKLFTNIY